jgi:hypothetical protein
MVSDTLFDMISVDLKKEEENTKDVEITRVLKGGK